MVAAFVYILQCADDKYYYGSTGDLSQRLAEHRQGFSSLDGVVSVPRGSLYSPARSNDRDDDVNGYGHGERCHKSTRRLRKSWSRGVRNRHPDPLPGGGWSVRRPVGAGDASPHYASADLRLGGAKASPRRRAQTCVISAPKKKIRDE